MAFWFPGDRGECNRQFQNPPFSVHIVNCPHCHQNTKPPPVWLVSHAWHCSHCGGAFGLTASNRPFPIPHEFIPRAPILSQSVARRWCFYAGQNPYVYALCYPNGIPFYVGSGVRLRAMAHVEETEKTDAAQQSEKHQVIAELLRGSQGVWYHFFGQLKTRNEAYSLENYYIDLWGLRSRGGMLTNDAPARGSRFNSIEYADSEPFQADEPKDSVRVFLHPDLAVALPFNSVLPSKRCPACGITGCYTQAMYAKKVLCPNCGHYFFPFADEKPKPVFAVGPKPKRPPPIRRFMKWLRRLRNR